MSRQAPQAIPQEMIPIETSAVQNSCLLHASLMPIFAYYSLGDKCPEEYKPTQKYVMDMLTRTDLIRHMPKKEKVLQDPQAAIIKFTQDFFRGYFVDIIKESPTLKLSLWGRALSAIEQYLKGLRNDDDTFHGMAFLDAQFTTFISKLSLEKNNFTLGDKNKALSSEELREAQSIMRISTKWEEDLLGPDLIAKMNPNASEAPNFTEEDVYKLKLLLHLESKIEEYKQQFAGWWNDFGFNAYIHKLRQPGTQLSVELFSYVAQEWRLNLKCCDQSPDGRQSHYDLRSGYNAPTFAVLRTQTVDGESKQTGHYSGCLPSEVFDAFNQQVIAAKGNPLIISKSPEHHRDESETQQQQQKPKQRIRGLSEGSIPQNPTPLAVSKQSSQPARKNPSPGSPASSFSSNRQSVFQPGDIRIRGVLPEPESGARLNKPYKDKPCNKVTKGDVTMWVRHPSPNQLEIRARQCENRKATPEQIFKAMAAQFLEELLKRHGKNDVSELSPEQKTFCIELIQPDTEDSRECFEEACKGLGLTPVFASNSNTSEKGKSIKDVLQDLQRQTPRLAPAGG